MKHSNYTRERSAGLRFDCAECGSEVGPYEFFWRLQDGQRICETCMQDLGVGTYNAEAGRTEVRGSAKSLVEIGHGFGRTHADEVENLGLKVGDTVRGKEGGPGWWHEVRLTVLWIGNEEVVYQKQHRTNREPDEWRGDGESANFSLACRNYFKEVNNDQGEARPPEQPERKDHE